MPLEETIQLLTDKAFTNNWFNETCMKKQTVSLRDPYLVVYSLMRLCVALKKDWNRKVRCYILQAICSWRTDRYAKQKICGESSWNSQLESLLRYVHHGDWNQLYGSLPGHPALQQIFTWGDQSLCQAHEHWPLVALQESRRRSI